MSAIATLFDHMDLLIVEAAPRSGGMPLPPNATVTPLRTPAGEGLARKASVIGALPYYVRTMGRFIQRADAVHTPLPGDLPLIAMHLAAALGKRVVARYGGSWESTQITTVMNRLTRASMRWLAGGRNVMLATGEGDRPPAERMEWVFTTALSRAELERIRPVEDRGLSDPPRLLFAGRLSPEKGVPHLIAALSALRRMAVPMPVLSIVGDGAQRAVLERLAEEQGVRASVTFTGQVSRQELSAHYSRADLCVQPSLTEGLSKVWLEAMTHGLPVITTCVGAAPSVIGRNGERGWLVAPGDAAALASVIERVLTMPIDWPVLRRRCREYAESRTLENWATAIGRICAQRWDCSLVEGKLAL
jgi:glycosyltransferase involved in cell wall biosynthesis